MYADKLSGKDYDKLKEEKQRALEVLKESEE
jgi:hypothetical protein